MQRKQILTVKLTPTKAEVKENNSPCSDTVDGGEADPELLERQERFPSRLRTTTGTGSTERSAADRRNEILSQQLKALNSELQAKLRAKTLENSQLKLELSKIRSEHDKDVRRAVLQQKKSTEMMARTLKHAEDVIKEKEQMISRQQETINKMSLAKTLSPRVSPPSSASSLGPRGQSFHGRTANQKAAEARGISSTDAVKPAHKFTRSASLRSNNSVTAFSSASRKPSLSPQKQPLQQKLQVRNSTRSVSKSVTHT